MEMLKRMQMKIQRSKMSLKSRNQRFSKMYAHDMMLTDNVRDVI